MELVCNIPDELYKKWKTSKFTLDEAVKFVDCVMNGTPLPEHHGDLGDLNAVYDNFRQHYFDNPTVMRCAEIVLGNTPTIIPATKEGESDLV